MTGNSLSILVFAVHKEWQSAGLHYLFFLAIYDSANLILYILADATLSTWGIDVNVFGASHYLYNPDDILVVYMVSIILDPGVFYN